MCRSRPQDLEASTAVALTVGFFETASFEIEKAIDA